MKLVFIIGCPRSGTTYLLRLLAAHSSFGWISNRLNYKPSDLSLAREIKGYKYPIIGKKKYLLSHNGKSGLPFPVEPWNFWNYYLKDFQWKSDFNSLPKNLDPNNLNFKEANKIKDAIHEICKLSKSSIFLSKYTDFPRMKYLSKIFPDAKFIHIVRDGRSVASSYKEKMDSEFATWQERKSWSKCWPKKWRDDFFNLHEQPITLAAYQWKFFIDEITNESKLIESERFLEINYSSLCNNPQKSIDIMLNYIGIKLDNSLSYFLKNKPPISMNSKWEKNLNNEEKSLIEKIICEDRYLKFFD
tara:strand:- start:851 stop:1756 length:906 start_codon:yes stop_codon:yes gene_type:complete